MTTTTLILVGIALVGFFVIWRSMCRDAEDYLEHVGKEL